MFAATVGHYETTVRVAQPSAARAAADVNSADTVSAAGRRHDPELADRIARL
jgi:hypothetical protein